MAGVQGKGRTKDGRDKTGEAEIGESRKKRRALAFYTQLPVLFGRKKKRLRKREGEASRGEKPRRFEARNLQ